MIRLTRVWRPLFLTPSNLIAAIVILAIVIVPIVPLNLLATSAPTLPKLQIMGPLWVGPIQENSLQEPTEADWNKLGHDLKIAKSIGITAVTTDIWWGIVEKNIPGRYDWSFYDRLIETIERAGLRWTPILSMHQLGGNVGDRGYIGIPHFLWTRYHLDPDNFYSPEDMKFKSEYGNTSSEYVSFWATRLILPDIKRFMTAFKEHFSAKAHLVDEIDISLGPSGELRYPSYNQHDPLAVYPSRGAIQAYSRPALNGFRKFAIEKYGSLEKVKEAWKFDSLATPENIFPPDPYLLQHTFWKNGETQSQYGKDFFDYYNEILVEHGKLIFQVADEVFSEPSSNFKKAQLSGKIPGVHWRVAWDRSAELCSGLIRSSYPNIMGLDSSFGYDNTLSVFLPTPSSHMKRILTFTCLEMAENRDEHLNAHSRAQTLVDWISEATKKKGIEMIGENALGSELRNASAYRNIRDTIRRHKFYAVTFLRLDEIITHETSLDLLKGFVDDIAITKEQQLMDLNPPAPLPSLARSLDETEKDNERGSGSTTGPTTGPTIGTENELEKPKSINQEPPVSAVSQSEESLRETSFFRGKLAEKTLFQHFRRRCLKRLLSRSGKKDKPSDSDTDSNTDTDTDDL